MVSFPPYLASIGWYSFWFRNLISGTDESGSVIKANEGINDGRYFSRTKIEDRHGHPVILSMSIEGGGRKLRSISFVESCRLSNHGDWRKVHLGSIEAIYGKTPFYDHIQDSLRIIYGDNEIKSLKDFNMAVHRVVSSLLLKDIDNESFNLLNDNIVIRERGKEIACLTNPGISVIDLLMYHGPEALPAILWLADNHLA